jgi:hypothetical protein
MDSEYDLRRAEELVAEGRRIVQQQKGRIIRLRATGVDTWDAQRALHLFEANLRREDRANWVGTRQGPPRRTGPTGLEPVLVAKKRKGPNEGASSSVSPSGYPR